MTTTRRIRWRRGSSQIEHRIYPDALRLVASGAVRLEGDICKTDRPRRLRGDALISPAPG